MHNPYRGYSAGAAIPRQQATFRPTPGGGPTGAPIDRPGRSCGLPAPIAAGPELCADLPGQNYCRAQLGGSVDLLPGAQGDIVLQPVNFTEMVARSLHMTATSSGVSPVTFTQAFAILAVNILGDNQLAGNGPVIGSAFSAQMTYLEVFWARVITATNPLTIRVQNLDPGLPITVFASVDGDGIKS